MGNGDKVLIRQINNRISVRLALSSLNRDKVLIRQINNRIPLDHLANYLEEEGFIVLDFDFADLLQLHQLPFHHGDPFDRLIIAQALVHGLTVISDDRNFVHYTINLLSA
ncbi:type II toxin-antitoxin system VapC family toxin [Spirosoma litoris]